MMAAVLDAADHMVRAEDRDSNGRPNRGTRRGNSNRLLAEAPPVAGYFARHKP